MENEQDLSGEDSDVEMNGYGVIELLKLGQNDGKTGEAQVQYARDNGVSNAHKPHEVK